MKLYILRHADAESVRTTDVARELTPLGLEQSRTVGEYCKREGIRPGVILTSPYTRTMQTAEIVGAATGVIVQKVSFLASGMTPERGMAELRVYTNLGDVMIVGHQPDLGDLIAALLGADGSRHISVGKASLTCLEITKSLHGVATELFSRSVRQM